MGYCKFQNTLSDLIDCYDHLWDDNLSEQEEKARKGLIETCKTIMQEIEDWED